MQRRRVERDGNGWLAAQWVVVGVALLSQQLRSPEQNGVASQSAEAAIESVEVSSVGSLGTPIAHSEA